MKDTIITARRKRTELITFLASIVVAEIINLISIIKYDTPMSELFTQIVYVLCLGCVIYVLWSVIRLIVCGVARLACKRKRSNTY